VVPYASARASLSTNDSVSPWWYSSVLIQAMRFAVGDDADVVFDEDDGDPLVVQLVEEGVEGVARLGVDADGRLVERE